MREGGGEVSLDGCGGDGGAGKSVVVKEEVHGQHP